jgi:protein involved in polysaccharide export with SLBB domain
MFLSAAALTLILAGNATGQLQSFKERQDDPFQSAPTKPSAVVGQPVGMALESVIDPRTYFVGPSDIFAVNIWLIQPMTHTLTVTPEGTLIIPMVGEVQVAGVRLAVVKERVLKEIRSHYQRTEATVTLIGPRPIVINVVGQVLNPGLFTLTAADRPGRALELANIPTASMRGQVAPPPPETVSLRNIRVRHRDGSENRVDIPLYVATKNETYDPTLREGDVVIVPQRDPVRNVIGIYGEVNTPGRFEFSEGDSLTTLFRLGNGFTSHARLDSMLFNRLSPDGNAQHVEVIDLGEIARGTQPNRLLQSGDRIVVPAQIDLRQDYRVHIWGEVRNPGTYPISRNSTMLSEALRLAGGFTEGASIKDGQLVRRSINPSDIELETMESARGGIASEDSADYQLETRLRIRKEIVAVDFERLFVQHDSTQDVSLRSDDYINIPQQKRMVYVFGQVVTNGYIPFIGGEPVEYYVKKAGGLTERARAGDVKIVKSRTRQWLAPEETSIEAGDYIWVPRKSEHSFAYYMNIVGQTASIVSVAVSIVLLVIQINK